MLNLYMKTWPISRGRVQFLKLVSQAKVSGIRVKCEKQFGRGKGTFPTSCIVNSFFGTRVVTTYLVSFLLLLQY